MNISSQVELEKRPYGQSFIFWIGQFLHTVYKQIIHKKTQLKVKDLRKLAYVLHTKCLFTIFLLSFQAVAYNVIFAMEHIYGYVFRP